MSLAAFLPLRSPHPHHRSPPDAFSPRVHFSPRPALVPMSRIRIETISRRTNDLPRDPSDWVDKDLLSYVRYNYSPIEAVSLSQVIERDRLTPTALWYLQAEPEQLLAIAEEQSLRDTLLGLALSLKPAVSPTSPRIRHVRRLSEDLERPPPPPPPPPPSPPTPEEPELEEDDDVAESVVSDWALDEDLDGNDGTTPTVVDLDDLAGSAGQPEPPLEGLGLHTGEPHFDNATTPQPQPLPIDADDLINLEDDVQPTVPPVEATEPHTTRTDPDDPPVEEPAPSQDASANAQVPDAAEEKPPIATHSADPSPPLDEASASQEAGADVPADPLAGSNTVDLPIEDDDLGNPWADSEATSIPDPSPPPPPADPARTASPTSDYHDANSIHSDEGERAEATPAEPVPEPSPVHVQQQEGVATSVDEEQASTETHPPTEVPIQGEPDKNPGSGDDAPPSEQVQQEETPAVTSEETPIEPPPVADPVQTSPPATDAPQTSPSLADPTQQTPSIPEVVPAPAEETARTQDEHVSPAADPEHNETAPVDQDTSKDVQAEVPPVQSTTETSGVPPSDQSRETTEPEGDESSHLHNDDLRVDDEEVAKQVGAEVVGKAGEDKDAAVPTTTTTESDETTVLPEATKDTVDSSPAPEVSSNGETSGVPVIDQSSTPETTHVVQPEVEVPPQDESAPEKSSAPSEPPASESSPSQLPSKDTTTDPTPATTAIDPPPSPTVRLASGLEAQLVDRDPDSTDQTPSPSDTPPNESSTPIESRQASPPTETKGERPAQPSHASIPSPDASSSSPAERKPPAPPRLDTTLGPSSDRQSRSARPSTNPRTNKSVWQNPSTFGATSPASAKAVTWGSAQSPLPKSAGSLGRGLFSSVTSWFNQPSEPSTRESSPERELSGTRMPAPPPARQPAARQVQWGQKKNWSVVASSSTTGQQAPESKPPPVQRSTTEPLANVSTAPVPPPSDPDTHVEASSSTPIVASDGSPPENSATQGTEPQAEEVTEGVSDSVLVDSATPSAGNGEPARDTEGSQTPPVQTVVPSEDAGSPGGDDQNKDHEDEDFIKVAADDVADTDKDAKSESRPQEGVIGGEEGDDDDDDAPLDRRLARVRQTTGDSVSSALTSDTETQGDEEQPSRRSGLAPRLQTAGLSSEPDGVGSPAVESPVVGTPTQSKPRKRKNKNKKKN